MAKHLNISVSTVSRALNNHNDVSRRTREIVLNAAEELNYRPNDIARSLISNKTFTIGLMVPDIADPYFSSMAAGVEDALSNEDYQVVYGNTSRDPLKEKKFIESVFARKMDGVILTPDKLEEDFVTLLKKLNVPFVLLRRRTPEGLDFPFVDVDHYGGAQQAVQHLIKKGHKKIGFMGMSKESFTSNERLRGYHDVMREYNLEVNESQISIAGRTIESGRKAMGRLYQSNPGLTAVFASNDLIGIGALEWLEINKIEVPKQMAVIGFDDLEISNLHWIQLTTMSQPRKQMGELSAELLLSLINGEEEDSIILDTELKKRKTC